MCVIYYTEYYQAELPGIKLYEYCACMTVLLLSLKSTVLFAGHQESSQSDPRTTIGFASFQTPDLWMATERAEPLPYVHAWSLFPW